MKKYADKALLAQLKEDNPSVSYDAEAAEPLLYVEAPDLCFLLEDLQSAGFNRLENITAVDYKTYYEMVYHLFNWEQNSWVVVKLKVDHDKPEAPSVTEVFPGANFEEREIFDLMGITLTGHPDLRRILLADDFNGHPLQKSYKQLEVPFVRRDLRAKHG